ncbi:MAG TPA: D-alanyl-D-alanine carboxypeptidase/D-alanyl-D-alanine-endopeptidase [Candidatus Acidoferrales bacterium]|nr:D-alanyl-D-alanine carboxypeptidase/D-alanyl-D-alanine-endopeptidase [Candidatus Acidoferrales bacterium]
MQRMTQQIAMACVALLACGTLCGQTPKSKPAGTLAQRIELVMNRPEFAHALFGVEVYSLDSDKILYEHNRGKLFVPGSTTKTVTEGTALELLGADYRFHTKVYRTGEVASDGTLTGDVILVASGDPNLSGRIQPDGTLAFQNSDHSYAADMLDARVVPGNPLGVMDELAKQIASRGIHKIRGRVIVDVSLFPEGTHEAGTGVVVSPVAVNDNVLDVTITPGAHAGDAATIQVSPETSYAHIVNRVTTGKSDSERQVDWSNDDMASDGTHTVVLQGSVPAGKPASLLPYAVPSPSRFAGVTLTEALEKAGVSVESVANESAPDFQALAKSYVPGNLVAEHISPPLSEEIKVTLKVSQNLHATMTPYILGAVLAHRHADADQAGLDLEHGFLEKAGLDLTQASQAEGAGGPGAFFTPDFMVHYLAYLSRQKNFNVFYRALPVLGRDGTLYNLLTDSPAAGHVHAKTGTFAEYDALNHTLMVTGKGLVGYVDTADGRHLIVAAYVNNVSIPPNFEAAEKVGNALAEIAAAAHDAPSEPPR